MIRALALALIGAAGPALALDLALPAGAQLRGEQTARSGRIEVPVGPWRDGAVPTLGAEGAVTTRAWHLPGADPGAVIADLTRALGASGWQVAFRCDARACGGFDFSLSLPLLDPPAMFLDLGGYRYAAVTRGADAAWLVVGPGAVGAHLQVVSAVSGAAPASVPPVPGGPLEARLDGAGWAVIDGVSFATGGANLSGGEVALDALAAWLRVNPDRRVALVGHTDADGGLAGNVALSAARARAVRDALAARGAPVASVVAEGAGWLAPRHPNDTAEGRAANRRVEAIVLD
ncbi:MAG: OmpA family protein [Paracoccaceae bacterium]